MGTLCFLSHSTLICLLGEESFHCSLFSFLVPYFWSPRIMLILILLTAAYWTTCWNNQNPSVFPWYSLFIFLSTESLQCHFRPQIFPVTGSLPSHPRLSCISVIRMTVSTLKIRCLVLFKRDQFTKFLLLWRGDKFGFNLGMVSTAHLLKVVSTAHLRKIAQVYKGSLKASMSYHR